jgi:hypothetical protein
MGCRNLSDQSNETHCEREPLARITPLFIARAGRDAIPTMNDSIDRFIARAIQENANIVGGIIPRACTASTIRTMTRARARLTARR